MSMFFSTDLGAMTEPCTVMPLAFNSICEILKSSGDTAKGKIFMLVLRAGSRVVHSGSTGVVTRRASTRRCTHIPDFPPVVMNSVAPSCIASLLLSSKPEKTTTLQPIFAAY